jgi:hypothetical protein
VEKDCNYNCDGVLSDCNCILSKSPEFLCFILVSALSPLCYLSLQEVPLLRALETLAFLPHNPLLPFLPRNCSSGVRWWVLLFYRARPGVSPVTLPPFILTLCLQSSGTIPSNYAHLSLSRLPPAPRFMRLDMAILCSWPQVLAFSLLFLCFMDSTTLCIARNALCYLMDSIISFLLSTFSATFVLLYILSCTFV